ncbi:MAG: hypothetical protein JSW60_06395 [Thermoplasmatales archaeon]|nr:MAG: hypothetical protein JSW60_06395 [Thermoplasmatales archaeon]
MKKDLQDIPSWLSWPAEAKQPDLNFLNESRKDMFEALSLFHSHVKYVIYIMASIPTALLIIMRLWPSAQSDQTMNLIAGIILVFVPVVGFVSIVVILRYYEVYVSALVFATRAHNALGYSQAHPWMERTIKQAQDWSSVDNSHSFLRKRAKSLKDSFALYTIIISLLSLASLIAGIVLLWLGVG